MRTSICISSQNVKHFPPAQDDTHVFLLSESFDSFKEAYSSIGNVGSAVVPCKSVWTGMVTSLTYSYRMKYQFFKWIGDSGQQTFIKKNVPLTILVDCSFGVSLNEFRKRVRAAYNRDLSTEEQENYIFDPNYVGNGLLYDLAKWSGIPVPSQVGPMSLEDAQVYIARWGGQPGAERFKTPYAIK